MDKERQIKVTLFVIGMMENLKDEGLLSGGYEMSDEGRQEYQRLIDSGFLPTDEEIRTITKLVFLTAGTEMADKALRGELPS